jgi:hypothetical protein
VPTLEDYAAGPRAAMLRRLADTYQDLERCIAGRDEATLARRPAPSSWSATEILCHLRDVEELFQTRFHTILALDEPPILVLGANAEQLAPWRFVAKHPLDPDEWAEDRQYARSDPHAALAAFQRRRGEVLMLFRGFADAEWQRAGIHLGRGRLTLAQWAASLAAHDDNHLAQLARAIEGRT